MEFGENKVLLTNIGGKISALSPKCTHYGAPLAVSLRRPLCYRIDLAERCYHGPRAHSLVSQSALDHLPLTFQPVAWCLFQCYKRRYWSVAQYQVLIASLMIAEDAPALDSLFKFQVGSSHHALSLSHNAG